MYYQHSTSLSGLLFSLHFYQCFYTYMASSMDGRRIILSEICLERGGEHLKVLQIFAEHSYWPFTRQ